MEACRRRNAIRRPALAVGLRFRSAQQPDWSVTNCTEEFE